MARSTRHFDAVIVGGGSGLTAAWHAVQAGQRVALITDRPRAVGGTCVNFGCIPTKALIQSADLVRSIRNAATFGIELDQRSVRADFPRIMREMRSARSENAAGARRWVEETMTPFYQRVRFVDDKLLETEDGQRISGDKMFIASGARAAAPPIDGIEDAGYWTNEDVLELEDQPDSLIVIGGGYVGCELGHFFSALGTGVTIVNNKARLLSEDEDVSERFTGVFGKRVALIVGQATAVRDNGNHKSVTVKAQDGSERTVEGEKLLLAAGRRPNTRDLGLKVTGVELDDHGAIRVNAYLQTAHPDIYAYGDVIGQGMFKHTSSYEGELAWRNAQGGRHEVSYRANPHAVFSDPQIGAVGLTEAECREQRLDYRVSRAEYAEVAKGKIIGAPPGFAKLIVERGTDRILGFHIIGPDAPALVHEVVVAMNAGDGKAEAVRRAIHIHPTVPELIQTVFAS